MTPLERLRAKIDVRGTDECWPWTGAIGKSGYGQFWLDGKQINASRAAYLLLKGPIPDGHVVCHSCDLPICCNPSHLWADTQRANVRDCNTKGRARGTFSSENHKRYSAKLTPEQILEARRQHAGGKSQSAIARELGVASSTISRAVRNELWGHLA